MNVLNNLLGSYVAGCLPKALAEALFNCFDSNSSGTLDVPWLPGRSIASYHISAFFDSVPCFKSYIYNVYKIMYKKRKNDLSKRSSNQLGSVSSGAAIRMWCGSDLEGQAGNGAGGDL